MEHTRIAAALVFALATLLISAGCGSSSSTSGSDVKITCADVQNQGTASSCTSSSTSASALAAEMQPLGNTTDGGTVSVSTLIEVNALVTNSGGTDAPTQSVFAWDVVCGPAFEGHTYSVYTTFNRVIPAGGSSPEMAGASCGSGPPGPAQAMIYVYPAGTVPTNDKEWTPDAYAGLELDYWLVNVTLQ